MGFGSSSLPEASLLDWILSFSSSFMIGVIVLLLIEARVACTRLLSRPAKFKFEKSVESMLGNRNKDKIVSGFGTVYMWHFGSLFLNIKAMRYKTSFKYG
ncbi:hypothetical protein DPMN_095390 [Dreissena polymorpha]|uniref:Uncharacterized protein n=1 Tax=Dreissena polymorpha TaxID=45954 RepID=A0A9D4R2T7_DREPO|nr:hypothetical protein DPMN_095390 [Dreissena polymorpha]